MSSFVRLTVLWVGIVWLRFVCIAFYFASVSAPFFCVCANWRTGKEFNYLSPRTQHRLEMQFTQIIYRLSPSSTHGWCSSHLRKSIKNMNFLFPLWKLILSHYLKFDGWILRRKNSIEFVIYFLDWMEFGDANSVERQHFENNAFHWISTLLRR